MITVKRGCQLNLYDVDGNAGKITGGTAGGVFVDMGARFNMYGGKITENSSLSDEGPAGGGVAAYGDFYMYGGVITGNSVPLFNGFGLGGGVFVAPSPMGSEYDGHFTILGDAQVYGNTAGTGADEVANNVCVVDYQFRQMSTNTYVTVGGELGENAKIGVTRLHLKIPASGPSEVSYAPACSPTAPAMSKPKTTLGNSPATTANSASRPKATS